MKLKNKLLPLAGIAAIAATVSPLALTSCGSTLTMVDLTKGYQPTISKHDSDLLGQNAANQEYFDKIAENSEIFKQDFLYGTYARFNNMFGKTYTHQTSGSSGTRQASVTYQLKSLKAGCTNPSIKMVNVSYPGEPDVQYPAISLDMQYEFEIVVDYLYSSTIQSGSEYYGTAYQSMDIKGTMGVGYKDVPFYGTGVSYTASVGSNPAAYWSFGIPTVDYYSYIYQFNTNPWSIGYDFNATMDVTSVVIGSDTKQQTIEVKQSDTITTYDDLFEFVNPDQENSYGKAFNVLFDQTVPGGYGADYWYLGNDDWQSIDLFKTLLPVELASLSFGSFYMNNILQFPEFFSRGNAAIETLEDAPKAGAILTIGTNSNDINEFPLGMSYVAYQNFVLGGIITGFKVYGEVDADGTLHDDVVFETEDKTNSLTIGEGEAITTDKTCVSKDYSVQFYALPNAELANAITVASGETKTVTFNAPKYIVVKPTVAEGYEGLFDQPQKIFLNQDTIDLIISVA